MAVSAPLTCVGCGGSFGPLDRVVAFRHDVPLDTYGTFRLPLRAPMHGDCANAAAAERREAFRCVERSPTGYPLRFERVA